jgi:hypothetical protein
VALRLMSGLWPHKPSVVSHGMGNVYSAFRCFLGGGLA